VRQSCAKSVRYYFSSYSSFEYDPDEISRYYKLRCDICDHTTVSCQSTFHTRLRSTHLSISIQRVLPGALTILTAVGRSRNRDNMRTCILNSASSFNVVCKDPVKCFRYYLERVPWRVPKR
jgi:hypothetical protein